MDSNASGPASLVSPRDDYRADLFAFEDSLQFMTLAAQALCQDEFSKCFEPKPVRHNVSLSLRSALYMMGVFIRYGILFPIRLLFLFIMACVLAFFLPVVRITRNDRLGKFLFLAFCKAWLFSVSAWVRHHGKKPRPRAPHIFVANHTSFIDFFMLSSWEFCHATVAQVHGGLFGFLQRHALNLNGSLFFYRDESKDREKLARRMRAHTETWKTQSPLLIFPEGTCVNNEYTVLFHKGAFELGCAVCPAAIKYNKRLLDPYWNTREQSFTQHLLYLMTRWMMIVDVWWLPATQKKADESSIEFADRVKASISTAAGLKNLSWNGYLKNYVRRQDQERLQESSQMKYGATLRKKLPTLIGEDVVKKETSKVITSPAVQPTSPIRRTSLSIEPGTLTDLRNEILTTSLPTAICNDHALPLSVHLNSEKDRLARSWKRQSTLRLLVEEDEVLQQEGQRLDNASWRLWSKHRKDLVEEMDESEDDPLLSSKHTAQTEQKDPLEDSVSMGINVD